MINVDRERIGYAARHSGGTTAVQVGVAAHIGISSSLADYKPKA
jgi:hypothetical protein